MAEDWALDVRKYVPDADEGIIKGIVRYCGIALTKRDSSLVAFSDKKETDRVRNNFLKKKLGLTQADSALDAAIAAVGERMKADRTKNRVTVYYLLADNFGKLGLFAPKVATAKAPVAKVTATKAPAKPKASAKATAPAKAKAPAKAAAATAALGVAGFAGGAAATAAANDSGASSAAAPLTAAAAVGAAAAGAAASSAPSSASAAAAPVAPSPAPQAAGAAQSLSSASAGASTSDDGEGGNWLWWLLGALLLAALLWWLFCGRPVAQDSADAGATVAASGAADAGATAAAGAAAAGAASDLTAAPAEGSVAIPAGAGVTSELRDGKPVVKVYFDSGKTDVAPAFAPAAEGLKAWLASHSGSSLAVSGYADKTGNAARNAELSKQRAQQVQAALVAAGVPEASAELVKPDDSVDASADKAAARRVEVVVR